MDFKMKNTAFLVITLALIFSTVTGFSQVQKVTVEKENGQWTFYRNGEPYYVKGAGGQVYMDLLIEIGGNSIRTWGIENAQELLDEAHSKNISVMMGLWVQHERHGFDYDDEDAVKRQLDHFTDFVDEFKDHPAILLWGIGNEVDLNYKNTKVWNAIQDIAAMCHRLDPNHPTTTVTAGLDKKEVELIMANAPDIDVYSVNTYGDIGAVHDNIKKFGWDGPYMITEWGPNGHWESPQTEWGAAIEEDANVKADRYKERYDKHIKANRARCIGSYVFLWGQKQETTSTWYGLFTEDGKCSPVIEVLNNEWEGQSRTKAPKIKKCELAEFNTSNIYVRSDSTLTLNYQIDNPANSRLKYVLQIVPESTDKKSGGDAESAPQPIYGLAIRKKEGKITFRAPLKLGAYRAYFYVYDRDGNFTGKNIPFYVNEERNPETSDRIVSLRRRNLIIPSNE